MLLERRTLDLSTVPGRKALIRLDANGRHRWCAELRDQRTTRDASGNSLNFTGHAVVFNKRTWIGSKSWGFWEEIDPGAATKTIAEADIRFLINHDPNRVLARNKAGTLTLSIDDVGVFVQSAMAPTSYALDLAISLDRGDITQMSFAFVPIAWEYSVAEDGKDLYRITEMAMSDVAVVTYPAYCETDAGLDDMELASSAFGELTRSLGVDGNEILRRVYAGESIDDLLSERSTRAPAESTPIPSAPAESTQTPDLFARHTATRHALHHLK